MQDLDSIWDSAKALLLKLNQDMPEITLSLWFDDADLIYLDEKRAVIRTPLDFKKEIITKRFLTKLEDSFSSLMGSKKTVRIVTDGEPIIEEEPEVKEPEVPNIVSDGEENGDGQPQSVILSNSEYTFENFIVGSSNKFAHSACLAVARNTNCEYNPLFIYGPSGLGKTHLLNSIINELSKNNPQVTLIYTKGEQFTNQMIESISHGSQSEFRQKYRKADVLLIDDIQFIAGKEATQEEFFHTFNELYEDNKQIILTSDRPPKDIKTLENRLKTRFESGLIADIQPPDFELRIAILKNKSKKMNVKIPDNVLVFIAENLKQNIRQLEGAIKRISARAFLSGDSVDLEMAKECLSAFIGSSEAPEVTAKRVISLVSKRYGVAEDDIYGKKRQQQICHARNVSIYIIKEELDLSYPVIGKMFGRDHSTIISSYNSIKDSLDKNLLRAEIKEIRDELNE